MTGVAEGDVAGSQAEQYIVAEVHCPHRPNIWGRSVLA